MLSKAQLKFLNALQHKKYRKEHAHFLAEGKKIVQELLQSELLLSSVYLLESLRHNFTFEKETSVHVLSESEMQKVSCLSTASGIIAAVKIPEYSFSPTDLKNKFTLALDNIQDPGNMGTIIRIADWYGIAYILCSENCVDVYNPKVIQATMGSIARIKCIRVNLSEFFKEAQLPVFGAVLSGDSIYETNFGEEGIVLIGNESNGISDELMPLLSKSISIPKRGGAESLNASIASGIICSELFRLRLRSA